jgi:hypothetical protein
MANCIVLHKETKSNGYSESFNINDSPFPYKINSILPKDKSYNKNPFIQLSDLPVFMHFSIDEKFVLNEKMISMDKNVKLHCEQTVEMLFNKKSFSRELIYLKSINNCSEVEYMETPIMYDPMNFMPIKNKIIRYSSVMLSDIEVENIILNNKYYSELEPSKPKLFYFDKKVYDDVEYKLEEIDHNLTDEEYSIYCELVKRLGIPKGYDILNRWMSRITINYNSEVKITVNDNKNYMYTLIKRNGKHIR